MTEQISLGSGGACNKLLQVVILYLILNGLSCGLFASISIVAKLEREVNQVYLTLEMQNMGADRQISVAALPWKFRYSLRTVLVPEDRRKAIATESLPISDPMGGAVVWKKGERLRGRLLLNERYDNFERKLHSGDIFVFWVYDGAFDSYGDRQLLSGCVILRE